MRAVRPKLASVGSGCSIKKITRHKCEFASLI